MTGMRLRNLLEEVGKKRKLRIQYLRLICHFFQGSETWRWEKKQVVREEKDNLTGEGQTEAESQFYTVL